MNASENYHLSAEIIEDAVLGRLTPDERTRVNTHLEGCAQCREAFDQESLIAAGTKRWARAHMKQKLAGQIATLTQRHVPWPHLLGAAALLVVIIGVGVLFRWREPVQERDLTFTDTTAADALQKSVPLPPPPAIASGNMSADQERKPPPRDDRESGRQDKKDLTPVNQQTRVELSALEEKAKEAQPAAMKIETTDEAAKPAGLDVWLGGNEVSNALTGGMQSQPAGASNQGVSLNRLEARKGTRKTESPSPPVFVIDQQPRGAMHDMRAANGPQDVPTHIVRFGDTLHVTLFLDPLLTLGQLQSSFARQVSADSFQVVLPDRILGYRIPQNVTR